VNGISNDLLVIDRSRCGNFTGDNRQAGGNERFTRDASRRILFQDRVENRVRNIICNFVRVAFSDRFRT
jgi:hypothetical protein